MTAITPPLQAAGLTPSTNITRNENNQGLIALWIGRALLNHNLRQRIISRARYRSISNTLLANIFDVAPLAGNDYDDLEALLAAFLPIIKKTTQSLEAERLHLSGEVGKNIQALGKLLNLSELEQELLGFFSLLEIDKSLEEITCAFDDLSRQDLYEVVSVMLDVPQQRIGALLKRDARLHSSGLLKVDSSTNDLRRKVDLLDGFADLICSEVQDPLNLLSNYFSLSAPAQLPLDSFPHLQEQTQNVLSYLRNQQQKKGINILIYGEPGTGKTQWVKALAEQLRMPLYDIANEDDDGDSVFPSRRVEMYKLAQSTLEQQTKGLILFDEIEDVFPSTHLMGLFTNQRNTNSKAWMNSLLETNPVPSFWITNAVQQIDPAYLRRFDLVVEMTVPPFHVRKDILNGILAELPVEKSWVNKLAKESGLVPAIVERAAKVAKAMLPDPQSTTELQSKLMGLINDTLQVQGKKEIRLSNTNSTLDYSLQFINTSACLEKLVQGLQQQQQGRLLLYGLPGTGKTAFGHHLAEQLEKPLLIKRASDLLSPYVGEAEKNIAAAFRQAQRDGAVLQIDEVDSFVQSRQNAVRSWEVSQVNEMLTQMEAFDGIFIASTNLMDNMDAAAMRRFDVKLEFKPLTAEQALLLFKQLFNDTPLSQEEINHAQQQLALLELLTPGDFAAVKRKFSLGYQEATPVAALEALREECSYKPGYSTTTGFGFLSRWH